AGVGGSSPFRTRDFDLVAVAPHSAAGGARDFALGGDRAGPAEEVARVGVLRDESQRLALPASADEDPRPGRAHGCRAADGLLEPVVLAVERAVVGAPHLQADLDRFLEALEALGRRRGPHAQAPGLPLVPRPADPRLGPAAPPPAQGGHTLLPDPRLPAGP